MPSITKILQLEFNSPLLRFLLSFYYRPDRYYTIPTGHLKGLKIWYDRSINYHAILGLWERSNFNVMDKIVKRMLVNDSSLTVYDIGANIGLFSLFFTKYRPAIQVVSFEAAPETVEKLKKNLVVNDAPNIQVVSKAVSNEDNHVDFFLTHHHKSSLLHSWASDQGVTEVEKITVPSVKLDTYVDLNPTAAPDIIKIDVEGGGYKVLEGASETIRAKRPIILFESHLEEEDDAVIKVLKTFQYKAYRITDSKWVLHEDVNYRDREGVWGTMLLIPKEKISEFNDLLV